MIESHSKTHQEIIKALFEYLQVNDIPIEKFVELTQTNLIFAEELFEGSVNLKISDIEQICHRLGAKIMFDIVKIEEII